MAHELEIVNGRASMAYAGATPWHRLGKQVDADATPEEMLVAANLDWSVDKCPTFIQLPDGTYKRSGANALVRSSDQKVLDHVSDDWLPVQNSEAFGFFKKFHEMGDVKMETAGSLHGGQIVWGLARLGEGFKVYRDDVIENYLLFINPHRYARSIKVMYTSVRVVCNNTLSMAVRNETADNTKIFVGNHRSEFDPEVVAKTLQAADRSQRQFQELSQYLMTKEYTDESAKTYLGLVFPSLSKAEDAPLSRPAQQAFDALDTQPGADMAGHTLWNLLNAVTYVTDNVLGRSEESRLSSITDGVNLRRKASAVKLIKEMADA